MSKRITIFFMTLLFCICFSIFRLYTLSQGESLQTAASQNGIYKLNVASARGIIYDCKKRPLVNLQKNTMMSVFPNDSTPKTLSQIMSSGEMNEIIPLLQTRKPFCLKVNSEWNKIISEDVQYFKVPKRYSDFQLASHILGYLDSSGNGVCGIEKAFNDYLNSSKGKIELKYKINALGEILDGKQLKVEDTLYKQSQGVVLTIDKDLQKISEEVAERYLKKGAIIITQVPNCEIRAFVSTPQFDPNNVSVSLNNEDSPLLNRGLSSYNLGSIFKLVTIAAAMETGINLDTEFDCTGSINVNDGTYHCFNGKSHGREDAKLALAYSCNTYFVNLMKDMDAEKFIDFTKSLGFGEKIELAPGLFSQSGNLPNLDSLKDPKLMANLSFGQGKLMATPIQVSGLINAIASKGKLVKPKLIEGLVGENLEYTKRNFQRPAKRAFSRYTADFLKEAMKMSADIGTGVLGKPEACEVAVKTGTAQSGIKVGEHYAQQAWYAGFFPANEPKYSVVVFAEDAESGSKSCGPAFKRIIEEMYNNQLEN